MVGEAAATEGAATRSRTESRESVDRRRRGVSRAGTEASGDAETEITTATLPRTNESFLTGVLLLLLVVFLWTASNFLTQYQLTEGYDKPFAVTYLNTSSFALYLIPFGCLLSSRSRRGSAGQRSSKCPPDEEEQESLLARLGFRIPQGSLFGKTRGNERGGYAAVATSSASSESLVAEDDTEEERDEEEGAATSADEGRPSQRRRLAIHPATTAALLDTARISRRPSSIDGRRPQSTLIVQPALQQQRLSSRQRSGSRHSRGLEIELEPLTLHETFILAAQFTIVWFLANLTLNVALEETSVASATTLSSTSGFFTLVIGSLVGVESFSIPKLGSVVMSFLGVFLVAQADAKQSTPLLQQGPLNPTLGDLLALASAFFYSLYVTLLKKRIGSESRVSMPLFFGFVGLISIVCLWPVGLLLHFTSVERIELPQGQLMWAGVGVNMAITFVSDMAYLIAMLKSSPLVATVGLSLTIPLALVVDLARGSHSGGTQADIGSVLVLASFVCIGLADRAAAQDEIVEQVLPEADDE